MAIQRWDPRRDLLALQDRMKQLFDEALSRSAGADEGDESAGGWKPPMDLFEEPQRYILRADLPGVAANEVEIEVASGMLTLRGERKVDEGVTRNAYLRIERPFGPFSAQVALPPSVETDSIRAVHRNGVIEIVLPKRREETPNRIEIASS